MRNEKLMGYVLHAKPYQEKRAIYQLFSLEYGLMQGVGVRSIPSFVPLELFVTGKSALKTFAQIQPSVDFAMLSVVGRVQYALLYMNEVLLRLLAIENACPMLWQVYHNEVQSLRTLGKKVCIDNDEMKASLRHFERALFDELGVAIDFHRDGLGVPIKSDAYYRFVPELGFVLVSSTLIHQAKHDGKRVGRLAYLGADLLRMGQADADVLIYHEKLDEFGQLQRDVMDYLLDYKPLHSRKLWQQSLMYQNSQPID